MVPQGATLVSFAENSRLQAYNASRSACRAAIFCESLSHKKDAVFHVVKTVPVVQHYNNNMRLIDSEL